MKIYIIVFTTLLLLLSACSVTSPDSSYDNDLKLISSLSLKEAISTANDWKLSKPEITSYINSDEFIVKFPDGREVKKSLPDNEMYVAIAPYLNNTHTCEIHHLSSCQGEMGKKPFKVIARDENGQVLFDSEITSMINGFFEMWLPRDRTINFKITQDVYSADLIVKTTRNSKTCITTAQLK